MNFSDLVSLGSGGAVIVTVIVFLGYLRWAQKESRTEREQERKALTDIIVNDLTHVGTGLAAVNETLAKNNEVLSEAVYSLREVRTALANLNKREEA
jgi:hypothetical protein